MREVDCLQHSRKHFYRMNQESVKSSRSSVGFCSSDLLRKLGRNAYPNHKSNKRWSIYTIRYMHIHTTNNYCKVKIKNNIFQNDIYWIKKGKDNSKVKIVDNEKPCYGWQVKGKLWRNITLNRHSAWGGGLE